MQELKLSKMLMQLRQELKEAQKEAEGTDLQFHLEDIELEVQFMTSLEGNTGGKVDFWVCTVEAGGKIASQTVHKLKFKMTAETADGGKVKVSSTKTDLPK